MNTQLLPLVIVFIMLSLGLTLTVADFRRVVEIPRPMIAALFCQVLILPVVCFGIVKLFALPPVLAVGLMLMAATPGGPMANIFSHVADGDLALNLTLTAVNAVLAIVMLPLILGISISIFMGEAREIPLQYSKFLQVFGMILIPVALGMLLRARWPGLASRLQKPAKLISALFLVLGASVALYSGWPSLIRHFAELGGAVLSFNLISLIVGYAVPRMMRLDRRRAIAISLEVGLHNAALAVAIAMSPSLLNNAEMAVPAVLYGILAIFVAAAFIFVVNRVDRDPALVGLNLPA